MGTLPFKVLKAFTAFGRDVQPGDYLELEPGRRTQSLVDHRFIVPTVAVEKPKRTKAEVTRDDQ